ncbi:MAG: hypothetical protein H6624_00810 [Bdellovibrionaceae bacterium]|nr:hypothetical protein [Bdellovibrionales bacterium]MCB9082849.1 hypothetical protein [Pseudobdellovibrionaceae bacterium]
MAGAISYELEFKPLDTARPPLSYKTPKSSYRTELPQGRYQFRIRSVAKGGRLGEWSESVELLAGSFEVDLKAPANGKMIKAKGAQATVNFIWDAVRGAKEYHFRVWEVNEGRAKSRIQRVFKSSMPVQLTVGRKYMWEVGVLTKSGVSYQRKSDPFFFTLYGSKIPSPEITNISLRDDRPRIEWRTVEDAKVNIQLFHREIGQDKWTLLTEEKEVNKSYWRLDQELEPGQYRIILIATGALRGNSDPATREFAVKPGHLPQ